MKNLTKLWSLAMLLTATMFMVSCDEDEPIIDVGEGLAVSNGYYFAIAGEDPVATAQINSATVDGDDFSAQERAGFFSSYLFLTAGDYNLLEVADRELVNTFGGATETVTDEISGCDYDSYTLVKPVTVDGSAFTIAEDGLYVVAYDESFEEIVYHKIETVGLIGSATPTGWGGDTAMEGSFSADGGTFTATDVVMRPGDFKFRFNCRWNIDRRIDNTLPFAEIENGYSFFTNFGGTIDNLLPGNESGNMQIAEGEDGTYDITFSWDVTDGFTASKERTGDAPEITFDPTEYQFGIIGDATAGGWDSDQDMFYKGEIDGAHTWLAVMTFAETGNFKFRTNDDWTYNIGGTLTLDEASLTKDGSDIPSPGAGAYYIKLSTADEGVTWNGSMVDAGWGLIGEGGPSASWDTEIFMDASFTDGITNYTYTGDFAGGEFKFRAGGQWDYNLGGDLTALTADGGNLNVAAGTYEVILSFDGSNYSATVTAQ